MRSIEINRCSSVAGETAARENRGTRRGRRGQESINAFDRLEAFARGGDPVNSLAVYGCVVQQHDPAAGEAAAGYVSRHNRIIAVTS